MPVAAADLPLAVALPRLGESRCSASPSDKKTKLDVFSAVEMLSFLEGTRTGISVTGMEGRLRGTACVFGRGVECPEALPSAPQAVYEMLSTLVRSWRECKVWPAS